MSVRCGRALTRAAGVVAATLLTWGIPGTSFAEDKVKVSVPAQVQTELSAFEDTRAEFWLHIENNSGEDLELTREEQDVGFSQPDGTAMPAARCYAFTPGDSPIRIAKGTTTVVRVECKGFRLRGSFQGIWALGPQNNPVRVELKVWTRRNVWCAIPVLFLGAILSVGVRWISGKYPWLPYLEFVREMLVHLAEVRLDAARKALDPRAIEVLDDLQGSAQRLAARLWSGAFVSAPDRDAEVRTIGVKDNALEEYVLLWAQASKASDKAKFESEMMKAGDLLRRTIQGAAELQTALAGVFNEARKYIALPVVQVAAPPVVAGQASALSLRTPPQNRGRMVHWSAESLFVIATIALGVVYSWDGNHTWGSFADVCKTFLFALGIKVGGEITMSRLGIFELLYGPRT